MLARTAPSLVGGRVLNVEAIFFKLLSVYRLELMTIELSGCRREGISNFSAISVFFAIGTSPSASPPFLFFFMIHIILPSKADFG
jgi:hypothetical protein